MPRRREHNWIVVNAKTQCFECLRCGETMPLGLPMNATKFCKRANAFDAMHADCEEQTAMEPTK